MDGKLPNCHRCKYYYVTWEKLFPHGCEALNFKSRTIPSQDVWRVSQQICPKFLAEAPGLKEAVTKQ